MEPEFSFPRLEEPVTCPYPEAGKSSPAPPPPDFLKSHMIIIIVTLLSRICKKLYNNLRG